MREYSPFGLQFVFHIMLNMLQAATMNVGFAKSNGMCKKYTLPQDVDNFLRIHLRHLIGGSRDFSGELLDFRAQGKKITEPKMKETSEKATGHCAHEANHSDSISRAEENWRNKGTSYTRFKCRDLKTTEYSVEEPESSTEECGDGSNESHSGSRVDIESINTSTSSNLPMSPPACSNSLFNSSNPENSTTLSTPPGNSSNQSPDQAMMRQTPVEKPSRSRKNQNETHVTAPHGVTEADETSNALHESINNDGGFYVPETPSPVLSGSNDRGREENPTYSRAKKPSIAKFFMSCPEAVVDLTANKEKNSHEIPSKGRTKRRNYLLRNAVHCGTYKIDGKVYFMRRTCAFDSLASILLTAALDDCHYRSFMEGVYNETFSFILKLRETGVTADLYKERFLLLKPFYESTESVTSAENLAFVTSYVATDNPTDLWTKLFVSYPSTFHTSVCKLNICSGDSEHNYSIQIDHSIIRRQGYKALQAALEFQTVICDKKCRCGYSTYTETAQGNNHIYVELGTRIDYNSSPISVRLNTIPAQLTLDTTYRLVGVIVSMKTISLLFVVEPQDTGKNTTI
ncbi:uncharacterized protein LOC114841447 [Diachasma alloeum]|uniref:uncharacterized protein LOC114841447 n=1 Tax=Diachasma alloeum TaxID=454923 RepID=UPI0010FB3996|nr:uncharacterized protein LOC114841447 [Diachasma alloeum]XP_028982267.1 uncharacterized protein LOC114841447 [Diachasma alloeum]